MRLMVGIPALNEELTIANVIQRVPTSIPGVGEVSCVVIDDGSQDKTSVLALDAGASVIRHTTNLGLGAAFRSTVTEALLRGVDILVTIDGDGQFNPEDIPTLIQPILDHQAQVCTASRFADPALIPEMLWIKKWGNHRVAALVSSLIGERLHDVSCGFRAYSREALLRMTVYHSFTYTHETLLDLANKHLSITEVPLSVRGSREFGESRVASNVLSYGWRTTLIMLRFYRDNYPIRLCAYLSFPPIVLGLVLLTISFVYLLQTSVWLRWAALGGGFLVGVAVSILFFGFDL